MIWGLLKKINMILWVYLRKLAFGLQIIYGLVSLNPISHDLLNQLINQERMHIKYLA